MRKKRGDFIRLLHTSDLHLSKKRPETLEALREVLDTAKKYDVDILTMGGDIFESEKDAEDCRTDLRKAFSGNKFEIIAIPGNHDRRAYKENLSFGRDLRTLTQEPFETYSWKKSVSITGVPFVDRPSAELISQLKKSVNKDLINVLLLHCTLDIGYGSFDFGDEDKQGDYFPITSSTLSDLGYNYVLAGHFHADFDKRILGKGCQFVYPGSPLSLSWKHTGKRKVAFLDTEEGAGDVKEIAINSFYYDVHAVQISPGSEEKELDGIRKWIDEHAGEKCQLRVEITGYGEMDEREFEKLFAEACGQVGSDNKYRNVENILRHPLYLGFKKALGEREDISEKDGVDFRAIEILAGLKAGGKIR